MKPITCNTCGRIAEDKDFKASKCTNCNQALEWSAFPKCPNADCRNHDGDFSPEEAFQFTEINKGIMGKIFRDSTAKIISCRFCGHIIGSAGGA